MTSPRRWPRSRLWRSTQWAVHWGGLNNPPGGLGGQLTKCRWRKTNIVFYVRENIAAEQFCVSSGERKGWKEGRLSPRHSRVLQLAAPSGWWEPIADLVRRADRLRRP